MTRLVCSAAVAGSLLASEAFGCVIGSGISLSGLLDFNQRASIGSECSFRNAGEDDSWSGEAAVDLGHGYISQKLVWSRTKGCPTSFVHLESLAITDCTSAERITVAGVSDDHDEIPKDAVVILSHTSVENTIKSLGQIRLERGSGFDALRRLAASRNVGTSTGITAYVEDDPAWDRIDPACGCKLYYPDSAGALQ